MTHKIRENEDDMNVIKIKEKPLYSNLAGKMIKIMDEIGYVKKNGVNSFQKYKYATDADISSAASHAMRKHNVFMFTSVVDRQTEKYKTRGGKDSFLVTVKLEVTFIDAETGESFVCNFYGDGSDSDDKAIYKAMTGAQKYALMKTFMVATGDDPEKDERAPSINKPELVKRLRMASSQGNDKLKEFWLSLSPEEKQLVKDEKDKLKIA